MQINVSVKERDPLLTDSPSRPQAHQRFSSTCAAVATNYIKLLTDQTLSHRAISTHLSHTNLYREHAKATFSALVTETQLRGDPEG